MQKSQRGIKRNSAGLSLSLYNLTSFFSLFPVKIEEPTFSQCRVHIEAAIKGIQPSEESSDDTSSTTLAGSPVKTQIQSPFEGAKETLTFKTEPQGAVEQEPEPVVEPPPTAEPEPVEEEPTIEEAAVEAEAPAAEEEEQQHQEAAHEGETSLLPFTDSHTRSYYDPTDLKQTSTRTHNRL